VTLLPKVALSFAFGCTTFAVAADIRGVVPDNIVLCAPTSGCTTETIFGRKYQVLITPRFTVKVALSRQGPYTRADVSIANNTGYSLNLSPEDFRVEVLTKKPRVLLYVPPSELKDILPSPRPTQQAASPEIPAPAAQPTTTTAEASPANIDESDPAARKEAALQDAAEAAAAQKDLPSASLSPNEVARGCVFFERDNEKKAERVNVVLPIAGVVFEFPYIMERR
jgi:hypothetical protein